MKVLVVFGTRPEAIKMAPIVKELAKFKNIETYICLTGQHREMLQQVLDVFKIQPDFNLNIMKKNQTLSEITVEILNGINKVLDKVNPTITLVHGDTTTTFVTALACFYKKIPIGHVEAGLRTYDIYSPYPEEFNREAVSVISRFHFAPTTLAKENLINEGKDDRYIYVTGNTAIDALKTTVFDQYKNDILKWADKRKIILITAHRRENLGLPMYNMFNAIKKIIQEHEDFVAIYPVHLNPKVREIAEEILGEEERIKLIEPLNVIDFHNIMSRSYIILTDSGGIQEEAPSLGIPVLVMRDTTERPEGIQAGTLKLVGTDKDMIYSKTKELILNNEIYKKMSSQKNPYGDGFSSQRIVKILIDQIASKKNDYKGN